MSAPCKLASARASVVDGEENDERILAQLPVAQAASSPATRHEATHEVVDTVWNLPRSIHSFHSHPWGGGVWGGGANYHNRSELRKVVLK